MDCRVCGSDCGAAVYQAEAPAVTSLSTRLDAATACFVCPECAHAQSPDLADLAPDLPDLDDFYDTDYRISLASDEHDQLYEMRGDRAVFRSEKQADLALSLAPVAEGAYVLDYGAAKAATLRAMVEARPDIVPHVFDVSEDYRGHWKSWLAAACQATYRAPAEWDGRFDLVCAHFVIEHVADPVAALTDITRLLKPDGRAFLTVPDVLSNPGDMLVVDHVNHFTSPSVARALGAAGLVAERVEREAFRGAFVIVARRKAPGEGCASRGQEGETLEALQDIAAFWRDARTRLLAAAERHGARPAAIYGAGLYGAFIAATLAGRQRLLGHLDRNPHVRASSPLSPVFDPLEAPAEIEVVYAGLNPRIARRILDEWRAETGCGDVTLVFLDGGGHREAAGLP